ncbi:MAG: SUMF1/EgtB/PvdO family nonheme iron enzyme, partial [Clostridiales bacterium]
MVLLIAALTAIVTLLSRLIAIKLINKIKNSMTAKNLRPIFEYNDVVNARKYFVQTKFQNQSPTRQLEPGRDYRVAKTEIIPDLIKNTFVEKRNDKFYLILADSGMGKTTFMINLYMKYCSVFNFKKNYKIKLIRFGRKEFINDFNNVSSEHKKDTILLMDAFDEYKGLFNKDMENMTNDDCFRKKFDEIIDKVQDFFIVIITSRSQYFPGEESNPYDLKIERSDAKGYHILRKIYLSPFDSSEIKLYLNRKYGYIRFWNRKKKKIAKKIIDKSPNLMVRPMLLNYVDYLVDENASYEHTYDIYEKMIEGWIDREAEKRKTRFEEDRFKKDLFNYSQLVALEIYINRNLNGDLTLNGEEAIRIAEINGIDLRDYEITGQSLLTKDAQEKWKFAHKSIYEFFVAKDIIVNLRMIDINNLDGMDMTRRFLIEKHIILKKFVFIKGDEFNMGSKENEFDRYKNETLHRVRLRDFYIKKYAVTVEEFRTFVNETNYDFKFDKFSKLNETNPITSVNWNDAKEYCKWISERYGSKFRLPTEAEWEFACRSTTSTPFNTGENLTTDQANYNGEYPYKNNQKGNYLRKVMPVGSYKANEYGIYDMHGNVWEWCEDWYSDKYYDECKQMDVIENPMGSSSG